MTAASSATASPRTIDFMAFSASFSTPYLLSAGRGFASVTVLTACVPQSSCISHSRTGKGCISDLPATRSWAAGARELRFTRG